MEPESSKSAIRPTAPTSLKSAVRGTSVWERSRPRSAASGAHILLFSTGHTLTGVTSDGTNIWTTGGYFIDGLEVGNLPFAAGCQHTAVDCNDNDPCTDEACDPVTEL